MARKLSKRKVARRGLRRDAFFIFVGVVVAIIISRSGLLDSLLGMLGSGMLASFVAGIFFTSIFTIAPSSVAFAHIVESTPLITVAIWGGLGALCGDLIIFFFVRDRFADDLAQAFKPSFIKHIFSSFHLGFFKWLSPLIGAFIIASPLPDELGLTLMGLTKTRVAVLVPISFGMNVIGIYALSWFAYVIV